MTKQINIILGPIAALVLGLVLANAGQPMAIVYTAAITLLTAWWWVTEALPIPATSLVPFVGFTLTGVLTHKEAASALGSHVILLLMGAFMLSKALEKSGVHKRFALAMIRGCGASSEGGSARKLVLAFMLTAAALSMWISNTATTLMLLPIALAVLQNYRDLPDYPRLALVLLLGIAYAASLGGVGTPIGTPPNIIFMSVYQQQTGLEMSFIEWMKTGLPIVLLGIPIMALWLTRGLGQLGAHSLPEVGVWRGAEKRVLMVFSLVALAWIFRPLWSAWLGLNGIGDSTIALAGVVLMFLVPGDKPGDKLLDWPTANAIPWGMLLLFAGGICIAKAFGESGLSEVMAEALGAISTLPLILLILGICLFVTFLTEITSNTATATLLMPILAVVAMGAGVDAKLLMIPAAISASCAFMLPVATAPNAIVYGAGSFSMQAMAREGMMLNILVALVTTGVCYLTLN